MTVIYDASSSVITYIHDRSPNLHHYRGRDIYNQPIQWDWDSLLSNVIYDKSARVLKAIMLWDIPTEYQDIYMKILSQHQGKNTNKFIEVLFEYDADPNIGFPLYNPYYRDSIEIIELFISKGANLDLYGPPNVIRWARLGLHSGVKLLVDKYHVDDEDTLAEALRAYRNEKTGKKSAMLEKYLLNKLSK